MGKIMIVQYIVLENVTNKILRMSAEEVKSEDITNIGAHGIDLQKNYKDSYIIIKFNEK